MSRSYRRFIFALVIGLVIFAVGAGSQRAAIWADGPSRYPEYRETAEEAQKRLPNLSQKQALKATEYQQPCRNPQGHDASDLCAQWRAADAAQRSARWAWWQIILSFAGVIGLVVTLWFNFEAWDQANESSGNTDRALRAAESSANAALRLAETAETNAKRELRAYLDFDGVRLREFPYHNGSGPDEFGMRLAIHIRNYGKTPAENVDISVTNKARASNDPVARALSPEDRRLVATIAPTDDLRMRFLWRVPAYILAALKGKEIICRVCVIVTYTDVFGDPHVLRCEFEGLGLKSQFSIIEGTRAST